ncbi:hypothetical protein [Simplicispira suum]|nr:hypothetical protein [Simplicispira suum]
MISFWKTSYDRRFYTVSLAMPEFFAVLRGHSAFCAVVDDFGNLVAVR